jgi:hypothetical protein
MWIYLIQGKIRYTGKKVDKKFGITKIVSNLRTKRISYVKCRKEFTLSAQAQGMDPGRVCQQARDQKITGRSL